MIRNKIKTASLTLGEILLDASEEANEKIATIGPIAMIGANIIAGIPRISLICSLHSPPIPPTMKAIDNMKNIINFKVFPSMCATISA